MEELKFIISELNKHFETDYNMISFDSLAVSDLLQVMVNVLSMVDATTRFEVNKNTDLAIMNILNALQTVKYAPEIDIDAADFREGLIMGKRNIIHPILYWLLSNSDKVKRRVYFATYVERVVIPADIASDPEVEQMNTNYEKIIAEFWKSFNENKRERFYSEESSELQEDTKKMAGDMSYLLQRLDIQTDKLKNIQNRENLLTSVKAYRREVQQQKKLQEQLKDHKVVTNQMLSELKSLQSNLNQMKSRRPENLNPVDQIAEEVQVHKILADSQLPKEEEEAIREADTFHQVYMEPVPTQEELDDINNEMEQVSKTVQALLTRKMALTNTNDDQLLPFRNKATIISNKKLELSNFIIRIKAKNTATIADINQKVMILREIVGGDVLHGDDLKVFIANLRERSMVYKNCRGYLQGLQAELGVMMRTIEVVKITEPSVIDVIKTKMDNPIEQIEAPMDDVGEVKYKCKVLYQEANALRAESSKVYEDMTKLRGFFTNFNDKFDETKTEFDIATGNMSDELEMLEKMIEETQENTETSEAEWKNVYKDIENYEMCLNKYSDSLSTFSGVSSILEQLNEKVKELQTGKKELEGKHALIKQQKSMEQDELEQLKRIKQMVLFKIQGAQ